MPTFIRPARVEITESGGSALAAIAGVMALAVIASAAGAIIADVITALVIVTVAAVLGSAGVLAIVLRRGGLAVVQLHYRPAPERRSGAARIAAGQPGAVSRGVTTPKALAGPVPAGYADLPEAQRRAVAAELAAQLLSGLYPGSNAPSGPDLRHTAAGAQDREERR